MLGSKAARLCPPSDSVADRRGQAVTHIVYSRSPFIVIHESTDQSHNLFLQIAAVSLNVFILIPAHLQIPAS